MRTYADTRTAESEHGAAAFAGPPGVELVDGLEVISIDRVLEKKVGSYQILVLGFCLMAAFVDGADRQSVALVAHNLASSLHLDSTKLGIVFSVDNLGAAVGAIFGGQIADRWGRRPVLIWSMALIAACTLATAFATSFAGLAVIRLIAGVGLGSAIPAFLTLASEYVSAPRRGTIAAVIYIGYPLGGAVGGLWTSYLLQYYTWPSVFYVGAILPGVLFIFALFLLPETMQFLNRSPRTAGTADHLARKINPALRTKAFKLRAEQHSAKQRGSIRSLFQNGLALPTCVLWVEYFLLFATIKIAVSWLPALLTEGGITPSSAAFSQSVFFIGAIIGELLAFPLITAVGSRRTLAGALVMLAVFVGLIGVFSSELDYVVAISAGIGIGIGMATSAVIAATAPIYGMEQRATGLGAGIALSRVGQVVSPLFVSGLIAMAVSTRGIMLAVGVMPLLGAMLCILMTSNRPQTPVIDSNEQTQRHKSGLKCGETTGV